jgi:geranyl-CoA carboxylase alpha subunit
VTFSKILVANRGEIACRVMRTARAAGYRTVAVYSDADAAAPHVRMADEAVRIGAAPAAQSYLRGDALIAAARGTGADAVHPGYGFLSESAVFAQACLDAGLVFIGPPPAAIAAMGDKALAKKRMIAAGVPCIPGYLGDAPDDARLTAEAGTLGYPLLVKAVAGGGGRGIRVVRDAGELAAALAGARREARGAFGDDALMLERLIEGARHVEIQVFADAHGNAVHLGERDCTAQRRRQKVVEEAPSPVVDAALRAAMGRDAVAAALAVGYRGAGTVEFVVDAGGAHFFLEMNTRLQVEHPVTEMVTGFDLVDWQLRVAAGEPLTAMIPGLQQDVHLRGHAIEARLYAEDPYADFAPQTGTVRWWRPGAATGQPGVRIDHGIAEGSVVSPFYDAMVAKVIVHGRDRDDAIRRLRAALHRAPLLGLVNNGRFLADLVDHADFRAATMTTTLIEAWAARGEPLLQRPQPDGEAWCVAAAALALDGGAGWRADSVAGFDLALRCGDEKRALRVQVGRDGRVRVTDEGAPHDVRILGRVAGELEYEFDGVRRRAVALRLAGELHLARDAAQFVFREPSALPDRDAGIDARHARAPLAGAVAQVVVRVGDRVTPGQRLVCIEAMKMEMWVSAQADATIAAVHVREGEQVASGALLVALDLNETGDR